MKKEKKKLWDILKENGAKIFFTSLALLIFVLQQLLYSFLQVSSEFLTTKKMMWL